MRGGFNDAFRRIYRLQRKCESSHSPQIIARVKEGGCSKYFVYLGPGMGDVWDFGGGHGHPFVRFRASSVQCLIPESKMDHLSSMNTDVLEVLLKLLEPADAFNLTLTGVLGGITSSFYNQHVAENFGFVAHSPS